VPLNSVSRDPVLKDTPRPRLLLPKALLTRGILAALAFIGPVFGVLYVIVLPDGPWLAVVITQIAATLLAGAGAIGYFRSAIWIGPDSSLVTERGFFGQVTSFTKDDAESILLAEVYTSDGSESRPQLVVFGADNNRLLRMRGHYWTRKDMDIVAAAIDVPAHSLPETVSMGELRSDYPHALYVLERHPVLVAAVAVLGTVVTAVGLLLVLDLIRMITG
jgi:hypothetical protein